MGPRPARLAHRVLRDGRGAARRRLRDPRRRQRPRLPPPRERGGADTPRARRRARPDLDAQRHAPARRGEDGEVRRQRRALLGACSTGGAARRCSCSSPRATTASRSRSTTTRCARRRQRVAGIRELRAPARRRPVAAGHGRAQGGVLRRAGRRLQHARGARRLAEWVGEANRAGSGVGDATTCAEMLGVLGLENLLRRRGRRVGAEEQELLERRARRRAPSATSPRPTACATSSRRARLGGARRAVGARARARVVSGEILYGRNAVPRGAARARRAASPRLGDDRRGARSRGSRASGSRARRARSSRRGRAARPPGRRAPRSSPTPTPTPATCSPRPSRCSSPSTRSRTRRTSARSAAPPRRAGATGLVLPERRAARGHAGGRQGVGRAPWSTCRSPSCATSPTSLGEARDAGCWFYGAEAGARTRYDAVDCAGGVVLVLGAEGRGLRPRVASSCDDLVSLPLRGRIESLNVSATAAVLLYASVQGRDQQVDTGRKAPVTSRFSGSTRA